MAQRKIGLVGFGKVARDRHLPAIAQSVAFDLAAVADPAARYPDVPGFDDLSQMMDATPDLDCVALCTPPAAHYADARRAIDAGLHVLAEKPTCATVAEVSALADQARRKGVAFLGAWHARHAGAVAAARDWLAGKRVRGIRIVWHEDVTRWHRGQDWIWRAGGFGVFDAGINGLSILTEIFPETIAVAAAELSVPEGCETPIAARLDLVGGGGIAISADFDWRRAGPETWSIVVTTDAGTLTLSDGGRTLRTGDGPASTRPDAEYDGVYGHFADLIGRREADADIRPLAIVEQALKIGRTVTVGPAPA